jgi:adenylosuccinate lyase
VTDTALFLGLQRSQPVIELRALALMDELSVFRDGFEPCATTLGRTHGQLAAPMPAEHRWDVLHETFDRCWNRVESAFVVLDVGKLSGPVGTRGYAEQGLQKLGLRDTTCTQVVPRDRLAHWAHCLAELVTVCEAIATQVWLLCQSGVNELRFAAPGTVGSSAMPHKTNPIVAENIRGLARVARSQADLLQVGMVQWGEHDLAHSSVERIAVPDLLHLTCTILSRTTTLVSGLSWVDPGYPTDYVDTSEQLRQLQAQGVAYVDAHRQLTDLYRSGKIAATTTEEAN